MVRQVLVFISHTQEMGQRLDGKPYVEGAEDAINAIDGAKARHMEFFPAADMSPADYSIEQLRDADIFLAIVGFSRGSTVPGEKRSYTELEFDAATRLGKERLLFLLHPSAQGGEFSDPEQIQFRQKLEKSGATVAYFDDVGDLKYKVSQAVARSVRARAAREETGRGAITAKLPPVQKSTIAKASSAGCLIVLGVLLIVGLGIWSVAVGSFPPWSGSGECDEVSATVTGTSGATFGSFSSGAALDLSIRNDSSSTISVPAARSVIARGESGQQYAEESPLADGSWFFGIEVAPMSNTSVQLGLASPRAGSDVITVVIPGIRGADWFLSRCTVTLDPVNVTFAG